MIHLAAQAGVRYSIEIRFTLMNIIGAFNVLEAAKNQSKTFINGIYFSVYGTN